jgi:hypothetical protein
MSSEFLPERTHECNFMTRSGEVSSVPVGENRQTPLNIACALTRPDHLARMIPDLLLPDGVPTPQAFLTNDAEFPGWEYPAGSLPDLLLP